MGRKWSPCLYKQRDYKNWLIEEYSRIEDFTVVESRCYLNII